MVEHKKDLPGQSGCSDRGGLVLRGGAEVSGSLDDLGDAAGADGAATLTDGEAEALLHGDGLDELDAHLGGVTGHDHLGALREGDDTGDVRGAEVELRTVVRVEGVVAAALVLGEDVDVALELGVRGDGAGLADDLTALDVLATGAAQEYADRYAAARSARAAELL